MNNNGNELATKLAIRLANVEVELANVQVENDRLTQQVSNLQTELTKKDNNPKEEQPK